MFTNDYTICSISIYYIIFGFYLVAYTEINLFCLTAFQHILQARSLSILIGDKHFVEYTKPFP